MARVGGVAQLGEHLLCKQGVVGSIPSASTNLVSRLGCGAGLAVPCFGNVVDVGFGSVWIARHYCESGVFGGLCRAALAV